MVVSYKVGMWAFCFFFFSFDICCFCSKKTYLKKGNDGIGLSQG